MSSFTIRHTKVGGLRRSKKKRLIKKWMKADSTYWFRVFSFPLVRRVYPYLILQYKLNELNATFIKASIPRTELEGYLNHGKT